MARPRNTQPTDGELEILKILWRQGRAELGAVCTALRRHRRVATTTVATILTIMLDKKLVTRRRGARGYLWSARVTQEAATRGLLHKLLDRVFDGSAQRLVAHLIEDGSLSQEDRNEIRRMVDVAEPRKPTKRRV